ncbi:MAG: mannonate dehydratase, partial [Bacilli bacterium]
MFMSFRWYGAGDPVRLEYIRQIPGMKGIVSALYDVPAGEVWPLDRIKALRDEVRSSGLELSVIESVPVHEDIKRGAETRNRYIDNFNQTLRHLAEAGVSTVCYNFMPVFDWTRSSLDFQLPDGATALAYDDRVIGRTDPLVGELTLPGWDASYRNDELAWLLEQYRALDEEHLWNHLSYFLRAVIPVAESVGVKMAIHPDDPPGPVFGLPRIITDQASLDRVIRIYDSPSNGLCICSGSLAANPGNNAPDILRHFGKKRRVNFVHARNIRIVGERSFHETAHLSSEGDVNMHDFV